MSKIQAFLNPYAGGLAGLDHKGRAMGVVQHPGSRERFVGSTWHPEHSKREGRHVFVHDFHADTLRAMGVKPEELEAHEPAQPFDLEWDPELPQELTHKQYFERKFAEGVFVPANPESATRLGMEYQDPHAYIARCWKYCVEQYRLEHKKDPACAAPGNKQLGELLPLTPAEARKAAEKAREDAKLQKLFRSPEPGGGPAPSVAAAPAAKPAAPAAPAKTTTPDAQASKA